MCVCVCVCICVCVFCVYVIEREREEREESVCERVCKSACVLQQLYLSDISSLRQLASDNLNTWLLV